LRLAEPLINAPQRVLDGFGESVRAACRALGPHRNEELVELFARAQSEHMGVAFRGSGRSYGDASLNDRALVLEMGGWNRILSWDPSIGVVDAEPGVTIEQLWRHTLADGFWPAVVPGTMAPTLGGCLGMNIHGKNNFKVGPIGDHVLDFDLLTTDGRLLRCSREENADVFHAAIGGFGMLGAFTRIRLRQKRVESGLLRVEQQSARSLEETFAAFERRLSHSDYLVGWIDALARGRTLGRAVIHQANYVAASEDQEGAERTLRLERQDLPSSIFGVPRSIIWRFMKPLMNDFAMRLLNRGKYWAALLPFGRSYLQSHVAFAFLLDYVPNWRRAYEPRGFIQVQPFVPASAAKATFGEILELCQREGLPPYLVVLKRHRPDAFLMSHALDGYSMAMDFAVPPERQRLWDLSHRLTDLVLSRGGKFYFAKDSVLRPKDVERIYGPERLATFRGLKARLDPHEILTSDLARRVGIVV
jgi:decaprenylphospho-beta-D-ribofuranose 2-oxidase